MSETEKNKESKGGEKQTVKRLWRVAVSDMNRFAEVFSIRLTMSRIMFALGAFFIIAVLVGVAVVAFTPVKRMLPGFIWSEERDNYEELYRKLDSLSTVAAIQNDYLENIMAVMSDSMTEEIPVLKQDSISALPADSILPTSENERKFVKQYEQREKYNLSVLSPIAAEGMTFFVPVVGAKFTEEGSEVGKSLMLITPVNAQVSSIYRGTVVAEYYVANQGITIVVQHPQDFMSLYSGIATAYVRKGEKVNAGTRIGAMSQSQHILGIELWHAGTQLSPREYIAF